MPLREWKWVTSAYWGLGETYRDMGRADDALDAFTQATDALERIRSAADSAEAKTHLLHDKVKLFEDVLALLDDAGKLDPARAFEMIERSRARTFLDLWTEARGPLRASLSPALQDREQALLDELSAATLHLQRAEGRRARREATDRVLDAERDLAAFRAETITPDQPFRWSGQLEPEVVEFMLDGLDRCVHSPTVMGWVTPQDALEQRAFTTMVIRAFVDSLNAECSSCRHYVDQVLVSLGSLLED